jgi:hypothetical protein
LAYADDINIVGENIDTIQETTETLLDNNLLGKRIQIKLSVDVRLSEGRTKHEGCEYFL